MRVKVKFTVKTVVYCRRRLLPYDVLPVNVTLTLKSGFALTRRNGERKRTRRRQTGQQTQTDPDAQTELGHERTRAIETESEYI